MAFLSGLSAFPITPADRDGRVDTVALRRLIARLGDAQVDSIGLLGSTGTYIFLSREERRRALAETLEETAGRMPVVVGVGALRTDEAVRLAQDAKALGAAAGLLAAASYTPLTDDEVFEHFSTVARESGLPIIVYDNPGTTHFHFTPALVNRLAKVGGIVAIKNPTNKSDAIKSHLADQRRTLPEGFSIGYSGDWNAAEAMIAGADTWYSVLAGILPEACMMIVRAAQQGDAAEARRIDATLSPLWSLFQEFSSLRVVYALAELLDICRADPPRPILPLPAAAKDRVAAALECLPSDASR
ncbi:dihydrodipicolinate synthase family protein [Mesorhizobium sp. YC-39]|uniref:4-hydroxy-tetrahydrodipicolinate synthase n=1 Tax=Mesorhizobium robiniae TaxID=559315 RepID=A0ABV2GXB3_9HYPH|nr:MULTISPECIES: dihydrodipicolinate synthase family protein [unclassified Mesorhizobium]MCV3211034.1 dihydrodipicolinate synthase family protein [Mesorhizobium sp. YC-2]MCV3232759.1 dihydrodipicolinate synthase family protein [Mesorhizobium sp. YC-39]MCV3243365.1 dihydrodipicolinate synthase family protein [Mesorhizobium sp. ZC-5]